MRTLRVGRHTRARGARFEEPTGGGPYALFVFRLSTRADPAFLAEMLYEAVNWHDDGAEERPPFDELLAGPQVRRYIEGWGRVGDIAIVALDRRDEPIGSAWYRFFDTSEPGYGFVAPDVPELSIAMYPEYRGQHIGELLLATLLNHARADGVHTIGLSVARENPARRLFERHGFIVIAEPAGEAGGDSATREAVTMIANLT